VREAIMSLIRIGYGRNEIAVLYRTHAQSRALETAMMRGGLPYQIIGGVRFYERREIKDLLGYLKLVNNPDDNVNFRRVINVPRRGIGKITLEKLENTAGEKNLLSAIRQPGFLDEFTPSNRERIESFSKLIAALQLKAMKETAYEVLSSAIDMISYRNHLAEDPATEQVRSENVEELLNETKRFSAYSEDSSLAAFLEEISLISDVDSLKGEEKVALMTLHNSKGLEFRAIFITGLEEGILPHYSSFDSDQEMEEERRLFYVGMTRAKEKLFLLCASSRMQFGNWTGNHPSRFLGEIPDKCCLVTGRSENVGKKEMDRILDDACGPADHDETVAKRDSRFRVGAAVFHPSYGEGTIKSVEGTGTAMKVSVNFTGYGTKKFLASYAPFTFR
jgi:DNA helicase-2/ATP-dependent DNA helicase PcrA